jgi:hypothetical protein
MKQVFIIGMFASLCQHTLLLGCFGLGTTELAHATFDHCDRMGQPEVEVM